VKARLAPRCLIATMQDFSNIHHISLLNSIILSVAFPYCVAHQICLSTLNYATTHFPMSQSAAAINGTYITKCEKELG